MAVYYDIINWSSKKSMFIRDAIRRLLNNQTLTDQDVDDIKNLIKKENGFTGIVIEPIPVSDSDIPSSSNISNIIRLKSIDSPHNITALSSLTPLVFSTDGLSIVYGKNGSGKSSYSKILKKLCWSRDKNTILKKNVYNGDDSLQSVKINFLEGGEDMEFVWKEGKTIDQRLNSILVFDSKCSEIYLNKENPSEYKPIGIDVLERLIVLFNKISQSIDIEMESLNKEKIKMPEKNAHTEISLWYDSIENVSQKDIESKLIITEVQKEKRDSLEKSLKDINLLETNRNLKHKKDRYQSLQSKLSKFESMFLEEKLENVRQLKLDYKVKEHANRLARNSYETDSEFTIGGQAWRTLWNAARDYALELNNNYPIASTNDGSFCLLCHQYLTDIAKERLKKFDLFVQDKTSVNLEVSKKQLENLRKSYLDIPEEILSIEIKQELIEDKLSIKELVDTYEKQISKAKQAVVKYINNETEDIQPMIIPSLSDIISKEIEKIDSNLKANGEILKNREKIEKEYLELDALNFLVNCKTDILQYYNEYVIKKNYDACKKALNTHTISVKIGELLESKAIAAQRAIFIDILNRLNPALGAKIDLRKTKTSSGVTFQKCKFNSIPEKITEILSEGEQKIVSIANFLSECIIDDSKNTIVLDDPISSLDIDYRESVAKLIVELAKDRQIIVMTHDLYFLRLLKDFYKDTYSIDSFVTCLNSENNYSGIVSDEIPYLAKNVQERIDTIIKGLEEIKNLNISQIDKKRIILNDLKDKMRQLLERTVEDVLINKTITRFSKNISFKKGNLANIIVVGKSDIDYLLSLYGKYSEMIHDGSIETVPNTLSENDIRNDIAKYRQWKECFIQRVKDWKKTNGYYT